MEPTSQDLLLHPDFTVLGSGLAGTLMSIYLARQGYQVALYERNADMRTREVPRGRSINLALSRRGLHALDGVGLAEELLPLTIPMRGRMIHSVAGALSFQPYGRREDEVIYSISRHQLNCALINAAERLPNLEIFFQQKCVGVDLNRVTMDIEDAQAKRTRTVGARAVIGADGAFSAVRLAMQRTERYDYSQEHLSHGYKELTIPAFPDGTHALEKNCLHIWPRNDFMLIALPNLDGSFTCTLFLSHEGETSFAELREDEDVRRFFSRNFPDVMPLMPSLIEDFFHNPLGSMVTVRCFPWQYNGRFLLIGDAAHAVVPFYGQGMNASFEDCAVLGECLQDNGGNTLGAFRDFQTRRKANTDALAVLAYNNYLEMRAKVASPAFLLKKKVDALLSEAFPGGYLPLYTMVSFTLIPYAEAMARAKRQDAWLRIAAIAVGATLAAVALFIVLRLT
jgi:kynurenine 3-monooxygenase